MNNQKLVKQIFLLNFTKKHFAAEYHEQKSAA